MREKRVANEPDRDGKGCRSCGRRRRRLPDPCEAEYKRRIFIVNAAECEPLIETDKYLCRTFADRIIRTIPQIAEAIGASKKVIA